MENSSAIFTEDLPATDERGHPRLVNIDTFLRHLQCEFEKFGLNFSEFFPLWKRLQRRGGVLYHGEMSQCSPVSSSLPFPIVSASETEKLSCAKLAF